MTTEDGNSSYLTTAHPSPITDADVTRFLMNIIPPCLVLLGTIGNGLTFAVMLRKKYRQMSTSVYLIALAVADTLYLYVSRLTIHGWEAITTRNMFVDSEWSCKVLEGFGFISTSCSAWLIVAVTLERVIAVALPHKARSLCTRKRAWQIVFGQLLFFCVIYIVVFVVYGVEINPTAQSGYECYMQDEYGRLTHLVVFVMYLFFYSFVPFCILMVSNLLIIIRLVRYKKERANTLATDTTDGGDTRRLNIMLVVISCYFVLTTLPLRIFWAVHSFSQFMDVPVDASKYSHTEVVLSLRTLANSNHAINFLLYCVSGRPFRQELFRMFRCSDGTDSASGSQTLSVSERRTANATESSRY